MDYKTKYLKYKNKCNELNDVLHDNFNVDQSGGNKNEGIKKEITKKMLKIQKKLKEKGLSFWFDGDGNVLAKGITKKDSYNKLTKKISKNLGKYNGSYVANAEIDFLPSEILNNDMGCIELYVDVNEVDVLDEKKNVFSFSPRNNKNSLLKLYYRASDLDKFKLSHIKKLAMALINNKIKKTNSFKFYHLEDLKDILDE